MFIFLTSYLPLSGFQSLISPKSSVDYDTTFITESDYITTFLVVDESAPYSTFSTADWEIDLTEIETFSHAIVEDTYVTDTVSGPVDMSDDNFVDSNYLQIADSTYDRISYIESYPINSLFQKFIDSTQFYFSIASWTSTTSLKTYIIPDTDLDTVTYNTKPTLGSELGSVEVSSSSKFYSAETDYYEQYGLWSDDSQYLILWSNDWTSTYRPIQYFDVDRLITNSTHVSVTSYTDQTIELSKTVSISVLDDTVVSVSLDNIGSVSATLTLGAYEFDITGSGENDLSFSIPDSFSLTEISISVDVDALSNAFQLTDLSFSSPTIIETVILPPKSEKTVAIAEDTYNVYTYIKDEIVEIQELVLSADSYIYYEKTSDRTIQLVLYDQLNNLLDFDNLKVFITYDDRLDVSQTTQIYQNSFTIPDQESVGLMVKDRIFDTIVYDDTEILSPINELQVQVEIYSLKIHNLLDLVINATLEEEYEFQIPALNYIEFYLPADTYDLLYQYDSGIVFNDSIALLSNMVYEISKQTCIIAYTDTSTNPKYIPFSLFKTYADGILITDPTFIANRNETILIQTNDLQNNSIKETSFTINSGVNYITIPLEILYLINNAGEVVNISAIENGHYQSNSDLSWDLETPNTQMSDFDYSSEGLAYLQNEYHDHNKVMYSNASLSNQYGDDEIQFDSDLYINIDDANTESSYLRGKEFQNGIFSNILHQKDESTVGNAYIYQNFNHDNRVYSFWMGTNSSSSATQIIHSWYEGSNRICYITFRSNNLYFISSISTIIIATSVDTMYHVVVHFNSIGDSADVYLNGVNTGSYGLQNNILSAIDKQEWNTGTAETDFEGYYCSNYYGDSLDEAMKSLYPSTYFTLDHQETNYKVDGCMYWGTVSDPDLSAWTFTPSQCIAEVVDYGNHNNQIKITSIVSGGQSYSQFTTITDNFDEFFWTIPVLDANNRIIVYREDGGNVLIIRSNNGDIFITDASGSSGVVATYIADEEMHWKVDWIKNGASNYYLNGNLVHTGTMGDFDINRLYLTHAGIGTVAYFDAWGREWDNYESLSNMIFQNFKSGDPNIVDWGTIGDPDLSEFVTFNIYEPDAFELVNYNKHTNVIHQQGKAGSFGIKMYDIEDISEYNVEFWANPYQSDGEILFGGIDDYRINWVWRIRFDTDGNLKYQRETDAETSIMQYTNNWYHFLIKNDENLEIYINGICEVSDTATTTTFGKIQLTVYDTDEVYFDALNFDSQWSNIPAPYIQNGTFEWWQNQNGNSSLYMNDFSLHWTNNNFTVWNSTDYELIQDGSQWDQGWDRYTVKWYDNIFEVYQNSTLVYNTSLFPMNLDYFQFVSYNNSELWIDAIDYTLENSNSEFIEGQNQYINTSNDLWCWNAFPEWESLDHMKTEEYPDLSLYDGKLQTTYIDGWKSAYKGNGYGVWYVEDCSISDQENMFNLVNDPTHNMYLFKEIPEISAGIVRIEVWLGYENGGTGINIAIGNGGYGGRCGQYTITSGFKDAMHHIILEIDIDNQIYSAWLDGSLALDSLAFITPQTSVDVVFFFTGSGSSTEFNHYVDDLSISTSAGYFYNMSSFDNATYAPLSLQYNISDLVYPYSQEITPYSQSNYLVQIADLYDNALEYQYLTNISEDNEIVYTPPNVQNCFISISDQQGNYLDWENFKLKLNDSLLYSNIFLRELDTSWNISIYDRFDNLLTSTIYTVERDENYIPLTITLYSMKIYNQHEEFIHVNITQSGTENFWSSWVAPKFIDEFRLIPGNYDVNITDYEGGESSTVYNVNFQSDDILLISSSNTLASVILSMENINTTLDTQFTYISLNFTNIDSSIGSQTTIIEINFENINTTFEDVLISQQNSFEFLNSSIETVLLNQENSFEFLNSTLNNLYTLSQDSFVFVNSSLLSLISYSENSFEFLNSSIDSLEAISLQSFSYLNSSIENAITFMAQNFTFLNSVIDSNQLEVLTQFSIVNSNITNYSIDIMNNILAVNSTISNLITDLSSNIFLVNDSIYTAILNSTSVLSIDNTQILGNLTITFQQNEFLTNILRNALFSDLLNWTGVGYNYSIIEDQIADFEFVNNYRTDSIELILEYQNITETMILGAMESLSIILPDEDVFYRVKSISTGEYLTEWDEIDENLIDIGFYEEIIPATPEDVKLEITNYLQIALFATVSLAAVAVMYIKTRATVNTLPKKQNTKGRKIYTNRDLHDATKDIKIQRNPAQGLLYVGLVVIITFIVIFIAIR